MSTRPDALWSIVYTSSATRPLSDAELTELLVICQRLNERDGISGVLLYDDGNFMQCLEGPRDAVLATYARIRGSAQHHGIVQLVEEAIDRRSFNGWAMGLARPVKSEMLRLAAADWQSRTVATAAERPVSSGRALLMQFWQNGRRGC